MKKQNRIFSARYAVQHASSSAKLYLEICPPREITWQQTININPRTVVLITQLKSQ